ncbi:hypothetical protein SEA_FLAGSTAFF_34 [Mycobacterium phage FlagStaff]|uniref:Uncharacterized protein n=1 Tax=Mycobacterium phage FlagStaff TaxID=1647304 RepID=A0A0F6WE51_9CAUD|nr:hypothetical protein AVT49_gp34 [Mycobacterium phage FlagStaff]AKF14471.1 hypothetical protein SEA_FLAGSTAFF_34 [Mycobacterium phage FlagStaff]
MSGKAKPEEDVFWTEAIYGVATRQPLVKVLFGKSTQLVSTDDARTMGEQLITTAMAADADAFLVEFLTSKVDMPPAVAVKILGEFRQWRVDKENQQ